jgi:hypothetical protein
MAAEALGVAPRVSAIPAWTMKAAGLVMPMMRELAEMLYQNDRDYLFDSSKFERRFAFTPTPYAEGIRATAAGFNRITSPSDPPPASPRRGS